uniref:Uncharacterized protein n=1 Tax=Timema tahoe TaxID=61484 RepID=A0A7R9ICE9_9NEOP|nr:unnamed protein product [Timema tahoe]
MRNLSSSLSTLYEFLSLDARLKYLPQSNKMEENIQAGVQKLYKEYQNLGKEKSRNTDKANVKRQIWKGDLVELFDISRQNVMDMTSVSQEDKEFLRPQREDRMSSSMSGVDELELHLPQVVDSGTLTTAGECPVLTGNGEYCECQVVDRGTLTTTGECPVLTGNGTRSSSATFDIPSMLAEINVLRYSPRKVTLKLDASRTHVPLSCKHHMSEESANVEQ